MRYCRPGAHEFVPLRDGLVVCRRCHKEELPHGRTCLVCGIPGEFRAVLRHSPEGFRLQGQLCGPCHDEFLQRLAIDGWSAAAS